MTPPVFGYAAASDAVVGSEVVLDGDEGHHATTARRLRPGELAVLTDGRGIGLEAAVMAVESGRAVFVVQAVRRDPRPAVSVVVVQALPKGTRGELAVELMTEVGVDRFVPWQAERCIGQWSGDRAVKGQAKWRAAAIAAAKQSRRLWWPEVDALASTADAVDLVRTTHHSLVLDTAAERSLTELLPLPDGGVTLVVGPEGGLAPNEHRALAEAGATAVRLGPTVLRTSTAGAVAATLVLAGTAGWNATPPLNERTGRD